VCNEGSVTAERIDCGKESKDEMKVEANEVGEVN